MRVVRFYTANAKHTDGGWWKRLVGEREVWAVGENIQNKSRAGRAEEAISSLQQLVLQDRVLLF